MSNFKNEAKLWLAQLHLQPLSKAISRADTKPIARYDDTAVGKEFVDSSKEQHAHPTHHQEEVDAFSHHVVKTPEVVKRSKVGNKESSNSTGKIVYSVGDSRYLLKPYHEKIVPRARKWIQHGFHGGWPEMTNQALYHGAKIGHLHQKVHVTTAPIIENIPNYASQDKDVPVLAIHMQPDCTTVDKSNYFSPEHKHQARQIALMDMLTNNLDRHAHNLLLDQKNNRLLAIDHGRSFQMHNVNKEDAPKGRIEDSLYNYTSQGGHLQVNPEEPNKDDWKPVFDWWKNVAPAVRKTMAERLKLIRDPKVRAHIANNFEVRAKLFDEYAKNDRDSFGPGHWFMKPVELHRFNG